MMIEWLVRKKVYHLEQEIDHLSERDRILLLGVILLALFTLWYFIILKSQLDTLNSINNSLQDVQNQTQDNLQKKTLLENLINVPQVHTLMQQYNDLVLKKKQIEEHVLQYNQRYIASQNLSKILDDMANQAEGVSIENFTNVTEDSPSKAIPPPPNQPTTNAATPQAATPQAATPQAATPQLLSEPVHYVLVLRGSYLPIMNYLKNLETLPWGLYWDKFDYSVTKYPQGLATINFYTLKPVDKNDVNKTKEANYDKASILNAFSFIFSI